MLLKTKTVVFKVKCRIKIPITHIKEKNTFVSVLRFFKLVVTFLWDYFTKKSSGAIKNTPKFKFNNRYFNSKFYLNITILILSSIILPIMPIW